MTKTTKKWLAGGAAAAIASGALMVLKTGDDMPPYPPGYDGTMASNLTTSAAILPKAFAVVPGQGFSFTAIEELPGDALLLAWNTNANATVSSAPDPAGPWSAVTNLTGTSTTVPLYNSNHFYQLSQSTLKVDRYWLGFDCWTFCGNNDVQFAINDLPWWESSYDYLMTLTNGVLTGFPLTTPGMSSCSPFASAIDPVRWRYFTLQDGCYYGPTGPFTFREWQLIGYGGRFTNAIFLNSYEMGDFGSQWGDMIRLQSGAIVACWKSPSSNYCFAYRAPNGRWQPTWCETNTRQNPSTMYLGQHPDGTVYCFVVRDGFHPIPVMTFREDGDKLIWQSTNEGLVEQEGEWSKVTVVPDHANHRLLMSRNTKPIVPAWMLPISPENAWGCGFQTSFFNNATNVEHGPHLPTSIGRYPPEPYLGQAGKTDERWPLNSMEAVNSHASVLSSGLLWVIRQEYNPMEVKFNLVYAQAFDGSEWGDKFFLYRAPDCDNCRGKAANWLTYFRNADPNPTRTLFANRDERGEATIFELR